MLISRCVFVTCFHCLQVKSSYRCLIAGLDRNSIGRSSRSLVADDVSLTSQYSGRLTPLRAGRGRRKSIFPTSSNLLGVQSSVPGIVVSSVSNSSDENTETGAKSLLNSLPLITPCSHAHVSFK